MPFMFNTLLEDAGVNLWDCALIFHFAEGGSSKAIGLGALTRQPSNHRAILLRPYWATFVEDSGGGSFAGIYEAEPVVPSTSAIPALDTSVEYDRYHLTPVKVLDDLKGRVCVRWARTSLDTAPLVEKAEGANKLVIKYVPAL